MAALKCLRRCCPGDHIFAGWGLALSGQSVGQQKDIIGPVFKVGNGAKGIDQSWCRRLAE